MGIRTYIFGNPRGWKLYNKDQSEVDYFKSFYVNTRRGERLMVNRRDDGSIVYVYVMYGIRENPVDADGKPKRGGYGHFGMAMIIDDKLYTPEFSTVFRFMSTLFSRLLERMDSPIIKDEVSIYADNGAVMPYSYRISKFGEADAAMEWMQSMMPKIFDKTGLISLADDPEFKDGAMGKIATLADDVSDATALEAFHRNRWIAISPEFKKTEESEGGPIVEINLFDLSRQHSKLTQMLLGWALSGEKVPEANKNNVYWQISEARTLLANYVKSADVDDGDIKVAHDLQNSYSELARQLDQIKTVQSASPDSRREPHETPLRGEEIEPEPYKHEKKNESILDSLYFRIIGVTLMILIIVIVSISLAHNKDPKVPGADTLAVTEDSIPKVPDNDETLAVKFTQLIGQDKFKEAYVLIKDEPSNSAHFKRLKNATEEYLWLQVDSDNTDAVYKFFSLDWDMLDSLGYQTEANGYKEWSSKIQLHTKLVNISKQDNTTKKDVKEAQRIAKYLGRYSELVKYIQSKVRNEGSSSATESATSNVANKIIVTVSYEGKNNKPIEKIKEANNGNALGFEVPAGKNFIIKSTQPISFKGQYKADPTPGKQSISVTAEGKFKSMTFYTGKTTITITVKSK